MAQLITDQDNSNQEGSSASSVSRVWNTSWELNDLISELVESGYFADASVALGFGIAYGINKDHNPEESLKLRRGQTDGRNPSNTAKRDGYSTRQDSVDEFKEIETIVRWLHPDVKNSELHNYILAYGEWGIRELHKLFIEEQLTPEDITEIIPTATED